MAMVGRYDLTCADDLKSQQYIFQDNFETGDMSKWDYNGGTNVSIVTSPVHAGTYSAKFHYARTGAGDVNVWSSKVFTPSDRVNVRAYLYVASPNPAQSPNLIVQRKLIWLSDSQSSGNNLGNYQVVLNSWNATQGTFRNYYVLGWVVQGTGGVGGTCQLPTGGDSPFAGSPQLSYDTWYSLEFGVVLNQPGQSDGTINIWLDGTNIYSSTGQNLRSICSGGLGFLALGEQANITTSSTLDEDRYWDDVVISNSYIGA